jgi:hypothetical protein
MILKAEDDFHFKMYSAFVIGRDINAARDIVHINIASKTL